MKNTQKLILNFNFNCIVVYHMFHAIKPNRHTLPLLICMKRSFHENVSQKFCKAALVRSRMNGLIPLEKTIVRMNNRNNAPNPKPITGATL